MRLLWLVTAIWAFSFSLIGEFLAATVDPYLAVSSRMLLALLLFSPFLLKYRTPPKLAQHSGCSEVAQISYKQGGLCGEDTSGQCTAALRWLVPTEVMTT